MHRVPAVSERVVRVVEEARGLSALPRHIRAVKSSVQEKAPAVALGSGRWAPPHSNGLLNSGVGGKSLGIGPAAAAIRHEV
jgi:hypothetical protein